MRRGYRRNGRFLRRVRKRDCRRVRHRGPVRVVRAPDRPAVCVVIVEGDAVVADGDDAPAGRVDVNE